MNYPWRRKPESFSSTFQLKHSEIRHFKACIYLMALNIVHDNIHI